MRKRKHRAKGLAGPRSHAADTPIDEPVIPVDRLDQAAGKLSEEDFADEPVLRVDLVDQLTDPRTDPDSGVVDQRRPRRTKCSRCYGQGRVPGRYPCSGRQCPSCEGRGYYETKPAEPMPTEPLDSDPTRGTYTVPELPWETHTRRVAPNQERPQTVEPGDVDYVGPEPDPRDVDHEQSDKQLLEQPRPKYGRGVVALPGKPPKRKTKKSRQRKTKPRTGSDTPPWELLPPDQV